MSGKDADQRRLAGELAIQAEALSPRALPVTSGVYQLDTHDHPRLVGSAVLAILGDIRVLLTAAHVLDLRHEGGLWIGVSPDMLPVAGEVTSLSTVGATSRADDHIDIGIVRLEGEAWGAVSAHSFASWDEFDIRPQLAASHTFGLIGYPVSRNKHPVEGERIIGVAYRMAGLECDLDAYRATGHDVESALLVGFKQQEMWSPDGMKTAPDLYGASGCGLWRYGRSLRDATGFAKLSAIAVEWQRRGRHRYILGTRLHIVVAALVEKYPDVREFVGHSLHGA